METDTSDGAPNELVRIYRKYVGEPDRVGDVYAGFGLFFGGATLGVIAVIVFLWGSTIPVNADFHWQLRRIAGSLGLLGLPALLLSIPVLLPVDRRAIYAAGVGAAVCVVGVGVFAASYPYHWNVAGTTDNSTLGVVVYAAGTVLLVGASGAGLVSDRVERARLSRDAPTGGEEGAAESTGGAAGEEVSDEQVRRDIDEAMSSSELSWGGVEKTETKRLQINTGDDEVDRSNLTTENANVSRSEGVDGAVSGLRKLRGNESTEATGEGADEQVAALNELRERQAAEEERRAEDAPESPFDRLRSLFGR